MSQQQRSLLHYGRRYDVRPPWWVRYTNLMFVPFMVAMGAAYLSGNGALFGYVLMALFGYIALLVSWSQRHKRQRSGGEWWHRL